MPRSEAIGTLPSLAIWGGIECSHIRFGDAERDYRAEIGHLLRPGDLDLCETGALRLEGLGSGNQHRLIRPDADLPEDDAVGERSALRLRVSP